MAGLTLQSFLSSYEVNVKTFQFAVSKNLKLTGPDAVTIIHPRPAILDSFTVVLYESRFHTTNPISFAVNYTIAIILGVGNSFKSPQQVHTESIALYIRYNGFVFLSHYFTPRFRIMNLFVF